MEWIHGLGCMMESMHSLEAGLTVSRSTGNTTADNSIDNSTSRVDETSPRDNRASLL